MTLMDTIRSSVAASKREMERNTGNTGAYADLTAPDKKQLIAGMNIARPSGISTIAGNNTTPFVPPIITGTFKPVTAEPNNVWTQTMRQAGQSMSPPQPIARVPVPTGNWPNPFEGGASTETRVPPIAGGITLGEQGGAGTTKPVGTFMSAAGPATGGFAINEDNRLREVALQDTRQREMHQAVDRSRIKETADAVDIWRGKLANATTPFELQQAQAGLTGAQTQLQTIAGIDTHKYNADQELSARKIISDAHVKAAEIAAEGNKRAVIAGMNTKNSEQQDKFQKDIYDNTLKSIDFTGITPTAAHEYATILAKTAGKGYGTIADPGKKLADAIVHPALLEAYRRYLEQAKTSDEYQKILSMMLKRGGPDAVHSTSIRGTAQLPRIQQAKVDPMQQTAISN